jgi:rhombotail lipoprotein
MSSWSWKPQAILLAVCPLAGVACVAAGTTQRASVLEFLYPEGSAAVPPSDVHLDLPVRVGLGFAPAESHHSGMLSETQKQQLLARVADAFRAQEGIDGIDVIPSHQLTPKGGFTNLDRLQSMYGIDLMALVSYDQSQFDETNAASLTYWTIIGAYFVPGDDTDTHTFVDTSVFDIRSRAMLFTAAGTSRISERSAAVDVAADLREHSAEGFDQAFTSMIGELDANLAQFREQAKAGTVRGPGTPAIEMVSADGAEGGTGVGAIGVVEGAAALLLLLAVLREQGRKQPAPPGGTTG